MKTQLKMKLAVFALLLVILPFQAEAGSCVGRHVLVWVLSGQDLTGDGLQSPDPYVVVKIGRDIQKTAVVRSNANPTWYKKFQFQAADNTMQIDVWDEDRGLRGDDDHLGTCMQEMVSGGQDYNDVHCDMDGKKGFVNLMYKCQ